MSVPTIERCGSVLQFTWNEEQVEASVRGLRDGSPYARGEVTWASAAPGAKGHLHQGLLSLNSTSSKAQLARQLAERHPDKDWTEIVEQLAVLGLRELRRGEPAVPLTPEEAQRDRILPALSPYLYDGQPFIFFGEAGSLKSYLAMLLAIIAATGEKVEDLPFETHRKMRVLYLDWESTRADHAYRLKRLEEGLGISTNGSIYHRFCSASLSQDIEAVQGEVLRLGTDLLVLDSLGPAAGGDLNSSESATSFYSALRTLDCTSIILAHTAKNADPGKRSVFGSVFFTNLTRGTAEVRAPKEPGTDVVPLGIYHRKNNLGPFERPLGLAFDFSLEGVTVHTSNVHASPVLAEGLPLGVRIKELLGYGSLKPSQIADSLGTGAATVRKALQRLKHTGEVVHTDDGSYAIPEEDEVVPF